MTAKELSQTVLEKAKEFGLIPKNDRRTIIDPKGNAIIAKTLKLRLSVMVPLFLQLSVNQRGRFFLIHE